MIPDLSERTSLPVGYDGDWYYGFKNGNRAAQLNVDRASLVIDLDGDGFVDWLQADEGSWSVINSIRAFW